MMDYLIYILMAWEAMQSMNPWIAYVNATGGGIIRASVLGLWSSNLSPHTISSILFWNMVAQLVVQYNIFVALRSKLSKFKPTISSISSVIFGFYGLSVAPILGWFSYYITACGGGIVSSIIRSKNLYRTVIDIFVRTLWTFIESILISIMPAKESQIFLTVMFIMFREVYYRFEGRNFVKCINVLLHLRAPTNIGIPLHQNHTLPIFEHQSILVLHKPQIRLYGCLCRRHIVQSF